MTWQLWHLSQICFGWTFVIKLESNVIINWNKFQWPNYFGSCWMLAVVKLLCVIKFRINYYSLLNKYLCLTHLQFIFHYLMQIWKMYPRKCKSKFIYVFFLFSCVLNCTCGILVNHNNGDSLKNKPCMNKKGKEKRLSGKVAALGTSVKQKGHLALFWIRGTQ